MGERGERGGGRGWNVLFVIVKSPLKKPIYFGGGFPNNFIAFDWCTWKELRLLTPFFVLDLFSFSSSKTYDLLILICLLNGLQHTQSQKQLVSGEIKWTYLQLKGNTPPSFATNEFNRFLIILLSFVMRMFTFLANGVKLGIMFRN